MNNLPSILLGLCCLAGITTLLYGLRKALERSSWDKSRQLGVFRTTLILLTAWVLLLGALSLNGFFADFSKLPPRPGLAMLLPLPIVLWIAFSKRGGELLRNIPLHWPIYLQSFRILVEITLWLSVRNGSVPVQMSLEGRNFDILTGLFAIPVGYYCFVKKSAPSWLALVYNIGGILLLLNVVVIAVLSMPTPLRAFHNEPANTLVGHFPFIYLPGLLVPMAYSLHILSLRQWVLLRHPKSIILAGTP
jgi:hypothetical protein